MPFEGDQQTVSLSDIDPEDVTFRVTTDRDRGDLVASIEAVGVINAPILKKEGAAYRVICGFRRLAAVRLLNWDKISARILPDDTSPLLCAELSISENINERPLNPIETSRALSMLSSIISDNRQFLETASLLGLPRNKSLVDKLLELRRLPYSLQQGILSGVLSLPSALMLSNLPAESSLPIAEFLQKLKLGFHKQKEVIELIQEISKRDDLSINSILNSEWIIDTLNDPEMEIPRKASLIRERLKKWRYPHLSAAERDFERLKGELKLSGNPTLKPPAGFEGKRYTVSFSFENQAELRRKLKTLEDAEQTPSLRKLLSSEDPADTKPY
jgi:ParB family chromosome partitioning protein